jgi:Ca-activated chloride channel family protein
MSDSGKLEAAKHGLDAFFTSLSPRDRVGLLSFSDQVRPLVPVAPFASNGAQLKATVGRLFPAGETRLYDAADAGVRAIRTLKDSTRINAVVVLTDGQDTTSSLTSDDFVRALRTAARGEGQNPRVFTIAYGTDADRNVLKAIADASGGEAFDGTPSGIVAVYRSISSFF